LKAGPALTAQCHQGYVEDANTSPTLEMAHLITAMRTYEANQRVIQAQDDRMGKAIAELGGTS
jgi:flagellar basal-body rod protein FlgG